MTAPHIDGIVNREEIENLLKIKIRKISFYQEALLHKSAMKQYNASRCNERLEFIGDSVLNLIVTRYLYDKYENEAEGFLTKMRTKLVSGKSLSMLASSINLNEHIRMNTKAIKHNWNENPRILEDTFEAIIGAMYLDMGLLQTKNFIIEKIEKYINIETLTEDTNYKDKLMRLCHSKGYELPVYELKEETGHNNTKTFKIGIHIEGELVGEGTGKTKKDAEQSAASNVINGPIFI